MAGDGLLEFALAAGQELVDRGGVDRIVAAAAQLVHERGVAATSLDDVRALTGTSKSQLYHYFTDKSALIRAVVELQVEQVLRAQFPENDPLDSMPALHRWRDRVVGMNERARCAGGCPLGRLASELVDADPAARSAVLAGFTHWQERSARGLRTMRERGSSPTRPTSRRWPRACSPRCRAGCCSARPPAPSRPSKQPSTSPCRRSSRPRASACAARRIMGRYSVIKNMTDASMAILSFQDPDDINVELMAPLS